jgi:hypothetical protein
LAHALIHHRDRTLKRLAGDTGAQRARTRVRGDDDDRPFDASRRQRTFRVGLQLGRKVRRYQREAVNLAVIQLRLGLVMVQHPNVVGIVVETRLHSLDNLCACGPGVLIEDGNREMSQVCHRLQDSTEIEGGQRRQHRDRNEDR